MDRAVPEEPHALRDDLAMHDAATAKTGHHQSLTDLRDIDARQAAPDECDGIRDQAFEVGDGRLWFGFPQFVEPTGQLAGCYPYPADERVHSLELKRRKV
jgi:hypothetical protein